MATALLITDKKGLKISGLSLGTVQLGVPYGIANKHGKPDSEESRRLLQAAVDGGVASFDTAAGYGESEQVLGDYFEHKPKPTFMTKMALVCTAGTAPADIERQMRKAAEASLAKLKIRTLPVLMLHHPDVLALQGTAVKRGYERLIAEGLVERAGVSFREVGREAFLRHWRYVEDDLFEAVQVPASILDQRLLLNGGARLLKQAGKIVFARSIFLQGLLFLQPEALPDYLRAAERPLRTLQELADREGLSLAQLAVSFMRDLEEIDSLVIGSETAAQLAANLRLMAGPGLSETTRAAIARSIGELPEAVLDPSLWRDRFN